MKNMLHKLYQSEKVLALSGLLFMLTVGGAYAVGATTGPDADGDGVEDSADMCVTSIIDQPSQEQSINHHIWVGGDHYVVLVPNKRDKDKVQSEFSMAATKGCSCSDIVSATGGSAENSADYKFGCTRGTIENWIKKVN